MSHSPEYLPVAATPVAPPAPTKARRDRGSPRGAAVMLALTTVVWGLSFPLMKNWQDEAKTCPGGSLVSGLTVIGLRMFFALILFGLFKPDLFLKPTRREFAVGVLVGLTNFVGFALQVVGLATTTPARSGFLTSLCSAWVPLLAWGVFRSRISTATVLGLALALAGAGVLHIGKVEEPAPNPGPTRAASVLTDGDFLTLIASGFFAVAVLVLDRLGRKAAAGHLTVGLLASTGLASLLIIVARLSDGNGPGLRDWLTWTTGMLTNPAILRDVLLLTVLSTVLAFHWMTTYQPKLSASRAALIYLLEPVFASLFSLILGHDRLTNYLLAGGGLILVGNLLVELRGWLREKSDS
jgi:drug/metabolite transporter (DMT)-like permease